MKIVKALLILFVLSAARAFAAEDTQAAVTAPAKATDLEVDTLIDEADFRSDTRGIFLHGTYVLDTFGKAIPVQIDFQWAGIRSFQQRKYHLTFDTAAGLTAGYGGNSYPTFYFFGGNLRGIGEIGLRLNPSSDFSLYAGATAWLNGFAVGVTNAPLNGYNMINRVDGLAGLNGIAALRLNFGLSGLAFSTDTKERINANKQSGHALLITAFVEESAHRPGSDVGGTLYTSVGLRGQFDIVKNLNASVEGYWGTAFPNYDPVFQVTNTVNIYSISFSVRKMLGPVWVSIDGQLHGFSNTANSKLFPTVYVTSTPTFVSAGVSFGVSL